MNMGFLYVNWLENRHNARVTTDNDEGVFMGEIAAVTLATLFATVSPIDICLLYTSPSPRD